MYKPKLFHYFCTMKNLLVLFSISAIFTLSANGQSKLKPLCEKGQWAEAVVVFEKMTAPDEYDYYYGAIAFREIDSVKKAILLLNIAENKGFKKAPFYLLKGQLYSTEKKYNNALEAFEQARFLDKTGVAPIAEIAATYYQVGELDKAMEAYATFAKEHPQNSLALYMECSIAYEQEYISRAYTCYCQNKKQFKKVNRFYQMLMHDLIKLSWNTKRDYAFSETLWDEYQNLFPDNWSQLILRESFYVDFNKFSEAEEWSRKIEKAFSEKKLPGKEMKSGRYLKFSVRSENYYYEVYQNFKGGDLIIFKLTPNGFNAIDKYTSTLKGDLLTFKSSKTGKEISVKNSAEIIKTQIIEGEF